jgi:hypothetical protein
MPAKKTPAQFQRGERMNHAYPVSAQGATMSEDHVTCAHGTTIGGGVTGPCFGMICTCRCCHSRYVLVNSASYDQEDGLIESSTHPEDLCRACGGAPVEYLHPDYEYVNNGIFVRLQRKSVL